MAGAGADPASGTPWPRPGPGALFLKFLGFGCLAFGGPVAQIAMIRKALVEEAGWMSSERFNRLLAVMQVLPGPEAHELCVHMGMRARGRIGGVLAGLGFMTPGFLLMLGLAWGYTRLDLHAGWAVAALAGLQVAVLAVIARAVARIGRSILGNGPLWSVGLVSAAATLAGAPFWLVLPLAGLVYSLARSGRRAWALAMLTAGVIAAAALAAPGWGSGASGAAQGLLQGEATAWVLFLTGLKAGLLTFGGAYTAIPFLRDDMVNRGWLTDGQFLDGVALAQVIPAPLIIFGTFAGYLAGGPWGALAVTAGVFAPAFAFSLIFYDRLEAVLEHRPIHDALDAVAAGAVGLIVATAVQLTLATIRAVPDIAGALAIFAGVSVIVWLWNSRWAAPAGLVAAAGAGLLLF